jgi:hypothetical protein
VFGIITGDMSTGLFRDLLIPASFEIYFCFRKNKFNLYSACNINTKKKCNLYQAMSYLHYIQKQSIQLAKK